MGWGADKLVKRMCVSGGSVIYPGKNRHGKVGRRYRTIVCDFNAWFRSYSYGPETTPRTAILIFWKSLWKELEGLSTRDFVIVICMDDYGRNNEMRHEYYRFRAAESMRRAGGSPEGTPPTKRGFIYDSERKQYYRYGERPGGAAHVDALTADNLSLPWERLWNTPG